MGGRFCSSQKPHRSRLQRNLTTVKECRHAGSGCGERAGDALFQTIDARLPEEQARSFPQWSWSPACERRWPSRSEAFADGRSEEARLQAVLATSLPQPEAGRDRWTGLDPTGIERPHARTSANRRAQPVQNVPVADQAITDGWRFSSLVVLPGQPSS